MFKLTFLFIVSHLNWSIPLNTTEVGGRISHVVLHLACGVSFKDFWSWVCAKMDLDVQDTELRYKYHTDCVSDAPHILATDDDLQTVIEHGQGFVCRVQTKKVEIQVHNLVHFDHLITCPLFINVFAETCHPGTLCKEEGGQC